MNSEVSGTIVIRCNYCYFWRMWCQDFVDAGGACVMGEHDMFDACIEHKHYKDFVDIYQSTDYQHRVGDI